MMHEIRIAAYESLTLSIIQIAAMKGFPTKFSLDIRNPMVADFSRMEKYTWQFDPMHDEIIIQWWEKQNG